MLKCRICKFQNKIEIVSHIESEHADLATSEESALDVYVARFELSVDDVVAPTQEKSKAVKGAVMSDSIVKIREIEMPKQPGEQLHVPKLNEGYVFRPITDDVCQDILEDKKVMFVGHTGTGKTSLPEQLAARMNQSVLRVNMNGQTTIGDFVGMWTVKGGETVWVDGTLPKAMREGAWLIVDELDFAEPAILSVLNAILEPNGALMLKEKGHEIVKPHKDFRVFATANGVGCMASYRGLYQGTNLMNEAFLDRWRVYHVDYMAPEDEIKAIIGTIPRMKGKERIAGVIVRVANMIRESFKNEEIACTFSTRRMLDWADLMIRYKDDPQAPFRAAESSIFSKVSKEDAEVIRGIIQRIMVGNTGK
jgi:cobaltochelatase CobS